jgi:serine protease Do
MRWIPDWLIYTAVVCAIVFVLFRFDNRRNAPEAPPDSIESGQLLAPPSVYDPEVLVDVGAVSSGLGTAFAISDDGWWMTARHVVDECDKIGIIVARGQAVQITDRRIAQFADLALLKTPRAPVALRLSDSENKLRVGQAAYHVGFPQGRPGEAASQLIQRETLIARGRFSFTEPVLAWAETGRTENLMGSLAGMSGGPAFDAKGDVIGVTVAESTRRGRIYTTTPSSLARLLTLEHVQAHGAPAPRLSPDNYGEEADDLRRGLAVAQVVCIANGGLF